MLSKIFRLKRKKDVYSLDFHLRSFDLNEFSKIKLRFECFDPEPGSGKYLDIGRWIPKFIHYAQYLGINNCSDQSILDIGSGPGYFALICKNYKHTVRTLDLPDNPLYSELINLIKVERREQKIIQFEAIPPFDIKFNLITAFAICFNNHATRDLWDAEEWSFFIDDMKNNHLKEHGRIFLEMNQEPDGSYYSSTLRSYFESLGAQIDGKDILISF